MPAPDPDAKPTERIERVLWGEITDVEKPSKDRSRKDRSRKESSDKEGADKEGSITARAEPRFEIRPWDVHKPRRLTVDVASDARFYRQSRGKVADLKVGDLVLVVPDDRVRADRSADDADPKPAAPAKKPADPHPGGEERTSPVGNEEKKTVKRYTVALGVLRLWDREPGEKPDAEPMKQSWRDIQAARTLLAASVVHFAEKDQKLRELREPLHGHGVVVGEIAALDPLTIKGPDKSRRFVLPKRPVILRNDRIDPKELESGQTVVLRSEAGPQPGRKLEAQLVAICQRPQLNSSQTRRLWMREQGVKSR